MLGHYALALLCSLGCALTPAPAPSLAAPSPAAVAVLESSSFAQIMMLSFGVKMRFAFHVFVNLFHLAISSAVNERLCTVSWPGMPGGEGRAVALGLG